MAVEDRKLGYKRKLIIFSSFVNLLTEEEKYVVIFLSAILRVLRTLLRRKKYVIFFVKNLGAHDISSAPDCPPLFCP